MNYAEHAKHKLYDAGFEGSNYAFTPFVLESTGGMNAEGEDFFKKLLRFANISHITPHCVHMGRGWQALSCVLQRSCAQMIANRITDIEGL